jgi:hypothetical protein
MVLLQLNPPLPVNTPKGKGLAHLVIDYGPEHNLNWTVFIDKTGECWTFCNSEIRAQNNVTLGRSIEVSVQTPLKNGAASSA